ncbi:hypothetical protein HD600_001851 [Microbacterium ginsengiterrae]|uniref:Uncharacterized protein n=1 Tax=Microbacterium ginsengiterrae TaxID=546115 RepID=A0A7W9FDJ2_9MICO|nr:hypothetical protein [Microbacterium ginsengiterrae]MBB5743354.1 hypothetical protein [Microbacterium ginsengiterrae]
MNASAETPATFSEALHAAIRDHGVTLAWLRSRLVDSGNPVSTATLSYWRSGARTPEGVSSLAAVEEIERILGLPRGHLGSRIGPSPRLGRVSEQVVPVVPDIEDAYAQTEAALSAPPISSTRGISCQVQAYIGADGLLARRVTRSLVQSTVDGLTHLPFYGSAPDPISAIPQITIHAGGRLGSTHLHPSRLVFGYLVELDEPLRAGGTLLLEIEEETVPGAVSDMSVAQRDEQHGQRAPPVGAFPPRCRTVVVRGARAGCRRRRVRHMAGAGVGGLGARSPSRLRPRHDRLHLGIRPLTGAFGRAGRMP